jgi:hypothetical protein
MSVHSFGSSHAAYHIVSSTICRWVPDITSLNREPILPPYNPQRSPSGNKARHEHRHTSVKLQLQPNPRIGIVLEADLDQVSLLRFSQELSVLGDVGALEDVVSQHLGEDSTLRAASLPFAGREVFDGFDQLVQQHLKAGPGESKVEGSACCGEVRLLPPSSECRAYMGAVWAGALSAVPEDIVRLTEMIAGGV